MLTTTDRYVLTRVLRAFVPACAGLCLVFFAGGTYRLLKVEGLSLGQVALALPWVVPYLLPFLIPLAYAVSVGLVFGRMVAEQEVLAFASLGIPGRVLALPAVALSLVLSLVSLWLTASLVPHCHQMRKEAEASVFRHLVDLGQGEHLSRSFADQAFDVYVRSYGPDGLRGIVIHYDLRQEGTSELLPVQVVAERGRIEPDSGSDQLVLTLEGVTGTVLVPGDGAGVVRIHRERFVHGVTLGGRRRVKPPDYATADLRRLIDEERARVGLAAATGGLLAAQQGRDPRGLEFPLELATRAAVATAPLLVTLLVVPLTLLLRARSPLVPVALGLVASCALFFTPLLAGQALAATLGQPGLVFLGCGTALAGAAGLACLAARR